MLPLGVSAVTVGFGFLITLNRPPYDLRSSWALIPIAQAMVALPLVVRTLLPTLRAIDPRLHEAAATLGAMFSAKFQVAQKTAPAEILASNVLGIGTMAFWIFVAEKMV